MDRKWADRVHSVVTSTVDLIQRRETEQAFGDIDRTLADALHDNQELWVETLCKHGAVMAHATGDREREIRYTKQALPYAKDRQFALYNLAELLMRDGQSGAAEQCATEAYQLSVAEGNTDNRELATAILRSWPGIAGS
jgi:Flp pilus assembly protein TadD